MKFGNMEKWQKENLKKKKMKKEKKDLTKNRAHVIL